MTLTPLDWGIVLFVLFAMVGGVLLSRGLVRGVADFLAAGRTAGRYLLSVSTGVAMLGAITIVAIFESNFVAGFCLQWWEFTMAVVILVITVSGWVIYRFRETRSLTLAEFFERRYSRRFRVFAGVLAFVSGLINFGIFPAVGARFFITFCGLPPQFTLLGVEWPTLPVTMFLLLALALFFVNVGGQIAVIIADFIQGVFVNVFFLVITWVLLCEVDWEQLFAAAQTVPDDASLLDPFHTGQVRDFNLEYFLIGVAIVIYNKLSWQGTQAYNTSARDAHEARMGEVLGNWRELPKKLFLMVIPVVAFTVLRHPDFHVIAEQVRGVLDGVEGGSADATAAIQNQMRVPLVLTHLLPPGLMGAFAAVMLAAFISTHDTYLHSWGSIFVQDVVLPFRRTALGSRAHLRLLRLSIFGVAIFIFTFSLFYEPSDYILLFFAITGAIFTGGAGAVIIGGLYWRKGTTAGAWSALIGGSSVAVGGIVVQDRWPRIFAWLENTWPQLAEGLTSRWSDAATSCPINGMRFTALSMATAVVGYVIVSLLTCRRDFDMDRLLHRGRHARAADADASAGEEKRGGVRRNLLRAFGIGRGFTRGDRWITGITTGWTLAWTVVFAAGTVASLAGEGYDDRQWLGFWRIFVWIQLAVSVVVVIWFTAGGVIDIRRMLRELRRASRDPRDDGFIEVVEGAGGDAGGE